MPSVSYIGTKQENGPEVLLIYACFYFLRCQVAAEPAGFVGPGLPAQGSKGSRGGLCYPGVGLLMAGRARGHQGKDGSAEQVGAEVKHGKISELLLSKISSNWLAVALPHSCVRLSAFSPRATFLLCQKSQLQHFSHVSFQQLCCGKPTFSRLSINCCIWDNAS